VYTDEERSIYEFQVNGEKRSVDPIAIMRVIQTHGKIDLVSDIALISTIEETMDRIQVEALSRIIEATRSAFDLKEFVDGEGILDSEVLTIFLDFLNYLDDLKKKSVTSPISSDSTAEMSLAAH